MTNKPLLFGITFFLLIQVILGFIGFYYFHITAITFILFLCFIVLEILGSSYYVYSLFEKLNQNKNEIERHKIELENIKNQLNPHFLFNNLNNIYAAILLDKEMALDYTRKFSDMMRFYHNMFGQEFINLDDEIDYMENYLTLEKYKLGDRLQYSFTKNTPITPVKIPPFLLSTIIEISIERAQGVGGYISIDVNVNANNKKLNFQVINSTPQVSGKMKKQVLLETLNHKLHLIYKDQCLFKVEKNNSTEMTTLQIPIYMQ